MPIPAGFYSVPDCPFYRSLRGFVFFGKLSIEQLIGYSHFVFIGYASQYTVTQVTIAFCVW